MTRYAWPALGGALVTAGGVMFAGGRPAGLFVLGFGLGIAALLVTVATIGIGKSGKFLVALADALDMMEPPLRGVALQEWQSTAGRRGS